MASTPDPSAALHGGIPADTIMAARPMSKTEALWQLGFFSPFDVIVLVSLCLQALILLFWNIFGHPTASNVLICCCCCIIWFQIWSISLLYRCMHFVIMHQARLETLPEAAAKIVMTAYSGGQR